MKPNGNSSAWYSDPDALLSTLQQSRRPSVRTPTIPGYSDVEELRRGGQGVVYIATQQSTKRRVAIKVLGAGAFASSNARRRFEREVDLAATLEHANIVSVYDSGETADGHPYFVMQFIDGVPLDELVGASSAMTTTADRVPTHARPVRETLQLFRQICDAVGYAHRRGVIHRDLKPSNIRIDRAGVPHVLDFGLAKAGGELFEGDLPTQMSMTGEFMGSLPWASPEQAEGATSQIDTRTDIYSLGVLLYQMLTGRFPYGVVGPFRQVLDRISNDPPTPPTRYRAAIESDVETIVLKCLEKEPARRYQNVGELSEDIQRFLSGAPIAAKRDSALYTMRKTLARYKLLFGVGTAFALLTVVAAIALGVMYNRATESAAAANAAEAAAVVARDDATAEKQRAEQEAANAKQMNEMLRSILTAPLDSGREARIADALDRTREQLAAGNDLAPEVAAEMRGTLGIAYGMLGLLEEAAPLITSAHEELTDVLGADHKTTLEALGSVGWLHHLQGDLDQSESIYREALAAKLRVYGKQHAAIATAKNDLAIILQELSKLEEAESLLQEAVAINVVERGANHRETLTSKMNLGSVFHSRGDLVAAQQTLEEAIAGYDEHVGVDHLDTLAAKDAFSQLLSDLGENDAALELARWTLQRRTDRLGPLHPSTLRTLGSIGMMLNDAGNLEEAAAAQRKAIRGFEQTLGNDHFTTISMKSNLAATLGNLGRHDEAIPLNEEVLAAFERIYGPENSETLRVMNNLASACVDAKQFDKAKTLLEVVVSRLDKSLGPEHPHTLFAKHNYSALLLELDQNDEALQIAEFVTDARTRLLGADNFDTLVAMLNLAEAQRATDDVEGAIETAQTVYDSAAENLGWEHWATPIFLGVVGKMRAASGAHDVAIGHYEQSLEGLTRDFGIEHDRAQRTIVRILESSRELGRDDLIAKYEAMQTPAFADAESEN